GFKRHVGKQCNVGIECHVGQQRRRWREIVGPLDNSGFAVVNARPRRQTLRGLALFFWDASADKSQVDSYAVPALVSASIASESVGNIRKTSSIFVISKTFITRGVTPVNATRRPDFMHDVYALTSEPRPDESR